MIKKLKVIIKLSKYASMHFVECYLDSSRGLNKIDTCNININDKQSTHKLLQGKYYIQDKE